uniref:Uncharacterized protein n=1 Tax=Magallana gigas TaxID=29159 RepID=A0A8W8IJ49_MAGGI
MLSQGVIDWQGRRIPGFRVRMPEKILTVKSSDNYNIPSESEAVIEGVKLRLWRILRNKKKLPEWSNKSRQAKQRLKILAVQEVNLFLPNKKTIYDPGEPRRVNTRAETSCQPRKKTSSEIQSCEKGLMMLLKCLGRYVLRYGMGDRQWFRHRVVRVQDWSVFRRTVRTNNDVEGTGGVPFYKLVLQMRQEAEVVDVALRSADLERETNRLYTALEKRIQKAWDEYIEGAWTTSHFLQAISSCYSSSVNTE